VNLKNLSLGELTASLASFGIDEATARRVFAAVFAHDRDLGGVLFGTRGLRRAWRDGLGRRAELPSLRVVERDAAPDGFVKYVFALHDGLRIEAVRIPLLGDKFSVCLSSQVGCALGCTFCQTGRMGFRRNLETWEIVDQLLWIRREAPHPIRSAVFMGMGEPFLNYDNVIRAARILSEPSGPAIAAGAITISTAGIVPAIRRFTREGHRFRLAVSLTAADTGKRRAVMPIEGRYGLDELMAAVRNHHAKTRDRVMLEYVLIRGFNTGDDDARALRALFDGLPVRFNLIEVNDASGRYLPPDAAEMSRFRDALDALGQPVVRRYSGGKDVRAGCGMLAT
jgi:23S rRNA (adenine2503-C2)-methyltransferase